MSQQREVQRVLFERVKALSLLVDKVLFDTFPWLRERGYKEDGSDREKPLAFALIDRRLAKLDLMKSMLEYQRAMMLVPPYKGLYADCRLNVKLALAKLKREYPTDEQYRPDR